MAVFSAMAFASCSSGPDAEMLCDGVPLELAEWRSRVLSDVRYDLHFRITSDSDTEIKACESVSFTLTEKADAVLDFAGERAGEVRVSIDSAEIPVRIVNEHIVIPSKYLVKGRNVIDMEFIAGNSEVLRP